MTAQTSQQLANALRAAGLEDLAKRAEADEFHDFRSPHTFPEMYLAEQLRDVIQNRETSPRQKADATLIRSRLINGDFDADSAESEEWAKSAEGQAVFSELVRK